MTPDFKIKNEIKALTAFRFLAAFYVFLFHLEIRAPIFGDSLFATFISEGAVGMTMFFVSSGFILSHAYQSENINLNKYFWNRFARIYPIYFLAAILALPWLLKQLLNEAATSNPIYAGLAGIILLIFGFLMLQAWLPQTFIFWNNSASWSISNEMFFYSVFPFIKGLFTKLNVTQLTLAFIFLSILSSMIPASAIVFHNSPESFALFYALPFFRIAEFICGIIAYKIMIKLKWNMFLIYLMYCFIIIGILHVVFLGDILPSYTLHNWIFIPAVCASLVLLYRSSISGNSTFEHPYLVWLGKISYCFYSFQFHVLEGLRWLAPVEEIGGLAYALLSTLILLIISAAAHHLVEEPARIWIRNKSRKTSTIIGATA